MTERNKCPSCGESLGLLRADQAKPGALFEHARCKTVLVLVSSSTAEIVMRIATEAEKSFMVLR